MIGAAFPVLPLGRSAAAAPPSVHSRRWRFAVPAAVHRLAQDEIGWVWVDRASDDLRSVANGGRVESDDGWDMLFRSFTGDRRPHAPDGYDPVTGRIRAWVRVIGPAAGQPVVVDLVYGRPGLTETEADPAGCWAGYLLNVDLSTGMDASGAQRDLALSAVGATTLAGQNAGDFSG